MIPRSEEVKKKEVIEQLSWDELIDENDLQVEVDGDTVIVSGTVANNLSRQAIERDVLNVEGIRHVQNKVVVNTEKSDTSVSDHEIQKNIISMIKGDGEINGSGIKVEVTDGKVYLKGHVPLIWSKELAEELAISASGVTDVINEISVVQEKDPGDYKIEKELANTFENNELINGENIEIESSKGIVRLTGSVGALVIKQAAMDVAISTEGVLDVIDELQVR